jgi:hypothetical protein
MTSPPRRHPELLLDQPGQALHAESSTTFLDSARSTTMKPSSLLFLLPMHWRSDLRIFVFLVTIFSRIAAGAPLEQGFTLDRGAEALALNADGGLARWPGEKIEEISRKPSSAGELRYGTNTFRLSSPVAVTHGPTDLLFSYHWKEEPKFEVVVQHRFSREGQAGSGSDSFPWVRSPGFASRHLAPVG